MRFGGGRPSLLWRIQWPTGVTFADAAAEYLRYSEEDRGCKPSTLRNYRNAIKIHLLPVQNPKAGLLFDESVWQSPVRCAPIRMDGDASGESESNERSWMRSDGRRAAKWRGIAAAPVASVSPAGSRSDERCGSIVLLEHVPFISRRGLALFRQLSLNSNA